MALVWQARHGIRGHNEFQTVFTALSSQGLRMIDVSGYALGGADHYACTWEQSSGPAWVGRHFLDQNEHQQQFTALTGQGFRPIRVSGYDAGGVARYASIWEQRGGPALEVFHHIDAEAMQRAFDRLQPQGFRPIDCSGFVVGGRVLFTALWEQSPMHDWMIRHHIPHGQFVAAHNHNIAHGFVPRRICGYEFNGARFYTAIWEKGSPSNEPTVTWDGDFDLPADRFQARFDELSRRGFQLVKADGGARFAAIWHKPHLSAADDQFIDTTVRGFMTTHNVPGVSVALTHKGRLVFARGFGNANPTTGEQVTTQSRFRSASVAKPITAVAIFRLVEAGRLALGDRVFGAGNRLGTTFGTPPYGNNIDRITVQHLLEHTSGWPQATDPMFGHPALDHAGLIGHMLDNVPLATVPGAAHSYCNFNYCVLGRIIERVSGLAYHAFVRREVFAPCGITSMAIAGDTLAQRQANEVVYTGQGGSPYGMQVARMDAHGGWIGTATDLARFLVRVDGSATRADILAPGTITTMATPTSAGGNYAKGWATNTAGARWHIGDLPGTIAIIVRAPNGFCWAILANSRRDQPAQLDTMRADIDALMWTVINRISDWPAFDLF